MSGILTTAMATPLAALQRFERGDAQMAYALGNIIGLAVGASAAQQVPQCVDSYGGDRLLDAVVAQMAASRQRRDYQLWRGCQLLASNCTRFQGEAGDRYRRRLLDQGLVPELSIALVSKDVHTRDAAGSAKEALTTFDSWQRHCYHCRRAEPADAEGADRLLLCARCKSRAFCGRECQVASWPSHKQECKELAEL